MLHTTSQLPSLFFSSPQRRPGRPKNSTAIPPDQMAQKYRDAYLRLHADLGYPPTRLEVAEQLEVSDRTLRRWLAQYKLVWPPIA